MALKTFVYIRDVDNLSDARYCAGMGVDLIGFKLDNSLDNSLDESTFKEISNWISGVKIVGEFGKTTKDKIQDILAHSTVDYLLVPEIALLDSYSTFDKTLVLEIDISQNIDDQLSALNFTSREFDYLLITSVKVRLNEEDKVMINELSNQYPVLLGFGINDQNAAGLIDELGLEGISLTGSSEIRPGFKDYEELADILESLEID